MYGQLWVYGTSTARECLLYAIFSSWPITADASRSSFGFRLYILYGARAADFAGFQNACSLVTRADRPTYFWESAADGRLSLSADLEPQSRASILNSR